MEPATIALAVNTAITIGTKTWDYFAGKDAARDAKRQLEEKKEGIMEGKIGLGMAFEGESELAESRSKRHQENLTKMTEGKLEEMKAGSLDRKSTLASSGIEKRQIEKGEESMWESYTSQSEDIDERRQDAKIAAYSRLGSGVSGVEASYQDIMSDIESLGV